MKKSTHQGIKGILDVMTSIDPWQPYFLQQDDLIFALKPAKLTTHQSSPVLIGFKEYLENQINHPLWVVHRLDQGTSGVIVFAKTKQAASELNLIFEQNKITKKYFFVHRGRRPDWTHQTDIQKVLTPIVNEKSGKPVAAETHIFYLSSLSDSDHLFCAIPLTGKTHQIRQHAASLRIPILGDMLYGKTPFSRLMLFAQELEFEWHGKLVHFHNPFLNFQKASNLKLLLNPFFLSFLDRQYLFPNANDQTPLRITHNSNFPIRIDRFGKNMVVYSYSDQIAPQVQQQLQIFTRWMTEHHQVKTLPLQVMTDRGASQGTKNPLQPQDPWVVDENGILLSLRTDRGFSYGVFLDQRANRKFIRQNSAQKNVLNLFAYTGAFSIAAAQGGAASVCTTDVSSTFIQWCKENFDLNSIDPTPHEFWVQEALLFLKSCQKRNRKFDLIICDPPSIGRSKDKVFKIDKDWETLLNLCESVLSKDGVIFFSNNFEKWSYKNWYQKLKSWNRFGFQIYLGLRSPDYEAFHLNPVMKSFFMCRGNHRMDIPAHCKVTNDSDLMGIKQVD